MGRFPSPVKHLNKAATHSDNRSRICILCLTKPKAVLTITKSAKENIEHLFGFCIENDRLPKVICATCDRNLRFKYAKNNNLRKIMFSIKNHSRFRLDRKVTRSENKVNSVAFVKTCDAFEDCHLCYLASQEGGNIQNLRKKDVGDEIIAEAPEKPQPKSKKNSVLVTRSNKLVLKKGGKNFIRNIKSKLEQNLSQSEFEQLGPILLKEITEKKGRQRISVQR